MTRTAIIAGQGALPGILAAAVQNPYVAALEGFAPADLTPDITFRVERLVPFLTHLRDLGIDSVTFAGAVQRPRLDPSLFDAHTAQLIPQLMPALQAGDDATLRAVIAVFEEFGLRVLGVGDLAPDLMPGAGILAGTVTPQTEQDAVRAARIAAALGAVDVGQGVVVQQGLCLGVETLAGTDVMLRSVTQIPVTLRPDPKAGRGLFYKAAKPGQDRRIDLPTIGLATLHGVMDAGLGALVWQAGSVILLDRALLIEEAAAAGIVLWSRAA